MFHFWVVVLGFLVDLGFCCFFVCLGLDLIVL